MRSSSEGGSGNVIAFLFGAIFNILANTDAASLTDYAIKAVVGGFIWLLFKIVGDYINQKYIITKKEKAGKKSPASLSMLKFHKKRKVLRADGKR